MKKKERERESHTSKGIHNYTVELHFLQLTAESDDRAAWPYRCAHAHTHTVCAAWAYICMRTLWVMP
eukprot:1136791-Pelagomonas_calceolata.AAC.12